MSAAAIYKDAGFAERDATSITSVRDVTAAEFIAAFAKHLKESSTIEPPEWVDVVKTAHGRELPPMDPDWYFVRAASIARKIYLNDGLGVGALARWYGKAKYRGTIPRRHHNASRNIIRTILIQLEAAELLETYDAKTGGRRVTPTGQRKMDTIARTAVLTA